MIILASKSPRRRELMKKITNSFLTYNADIDESLSYSLPTPLEAVIDIAKRKALKAKEEFPNDLVIAADTIVVLDKEIIHKPIDEEDAKRILRKLSDKTHLVITAYAINEKDELIEDYVISKVTFNKLSDELIEKYVLSKSPLDKAGAYGIQDNEKYPIIKSYEGSYDNIVGFPIEEIKNTLVLSKKLG